MDYRSVQLMEDITLDDKSSSKSNQFSSKSNKDKNDRCFLRKLKVEMQTLRISEESEKQLYDTLKQIYGSSFKLYDASEFENKKSSLSKQYWIERGNLVIKGVVNYSSKDNTPKIHDQITKEFATSRLESYGFHLSHCVEALIHAKGDMGRSLEILFAKYYEVEEDLCNGRNSDAFDIDELLERRREEKEALESIYGDVFHEKIKDQIWIVQLNLDYLVNNEKNEDIKEKEKKPQKDICRLFLYKTCRFGNKCRFLHQQPQPQKTTVQTDSTFTLEIRFPKGCKYPYEPPYFYFYKKDGLYPRINRLRIAKRLYDEAKLLANDGTPSIFSLISLLEDEFDIKTYLQESTEQFLDQNDSLFPSLSLNEDETGVSTHHEMGTINKRSKDKSSWEQIVKNDDFIQKRFEEKQNNPKYKKMREVRKSLPAWSKMSEITEAIRDFQVIIISGETGCGKSTQVPQFVLDDWIMNRSEKKDHVNIVCTQPRRISAIGVAERVAAERAEHLGNTVGYQIRLESKMSSSTRLTFCTTGILLQRLAASPELNDVTHIIIDEVHERSAESDLLLLLLKDLTTKRRDLKVILMSATIKSEAFSSYFGDILTVYIPGKTFPVEQIFLEDILERTDYILEENSTYTRKIKENWEQLEIDLEIADTMGSAATHKETTADDRLMLAQLINRYRMYSKQTQKILYVMDHEKINFELIEKIIEWIVDGDHEYPTTGSILVFLPGFSEIITLRDQLNNNKNLSSKSGKFIIIPLHSSLSSEEQSLVFKKVAQGVRKIVLSTNIAETSITIDDCVFVIDTGKMKETRFNSHQNIESLDTCWVSRANALQRKGRAGRVMPGVCVHLYTSYWYKYQLSSEPIPEILRIRLEPLLLRIRQMHKVKCVDLQKTLGKLLDPPRSGNISSAIKNLQDIGAFDSDHKLTPLGHHLAMLPVNVRIGKLILFGAIFCCLDSALTIAACLSYKNPFTVSFEKRHEMDSAKKEFFTANSDQLTVLKAYKKWQEACSRSNRAGQVFADENYLSTRILHTLADVKYQLLELLVSIGFVPIDLPKRQANIDNILEITGFALNVNNENYKLLQGLLCAALYPNVVKVYTPEKSFKVQYVGAVPVQPKPEDLKFQTKSDGFVNIHPSSVNSHVGHFSSPYLVYQEKIKTSKVFIREVSMVPILSLILFSSYELNIELHDGTFILSLDDGWIVFAVESHRVAQLLQYIRTELAKLLERKMQDPLLNLLNNQNGKKIIHTIVNLATKE